MRVIKRDIVGAILISRDGKILLGKSAPRAGGVYSSLWVIPGGGIEEGETREEALIREVREETHIDIKDRKLKLLEDTATGKSKKKLKETGEWVMVEMQFIDYLVQLDETAEEIGVSPSQELPTLQWFSKDEILEKEVSAPTFELLTKMGFADT